MHEGGKKFPQKKTLRIVQGFKVLEHKKRLGICTCFRIMDIRKLLGRDEFTGFLYMYTYKTSKGYF